MATAIVIAGAGARGAYEAGVLSVVIPKLHDEGERDIVILGTSAGAINAAILAEAADSPLKVHTRLRQVWTGLEQKAVFDLKKRRIVWDALKLGVLGKKRAHPYSLFDATALEETIDSNKYVNWETLRHNIGSTWVKAVGVVATQVVTGRSIVFVQGLQKAPAANETRGIEYVRTEDCEDVGLHGKHIRASAAIPMAFPSVHIPMPGRYEGEKCWLSDGGTRLNTPINPAVAILGALGWSQGRVLIVGTHPLKEPDEPTANPHDDGQPDIIDEGASILHSIFIDRVAEDVRHLRRRNDILSSASVGAGVTTFDGSTQRVIPHAYFGPPRSGLIAMKASEVFAELYSKKPWSDFGVISRALGGESASRNELLSYLFFEPRYLEEIFELGQKHATTATPHGIPWLGASRRNPQSYECKSEHSPGDQKSA